MACRDAARNAQPDPSRRTRWRRPGSALLAVSLVVLLAPATAGAVVPITNGPIAFDRGPVGGESIGLANPDGSNADDSLVATDAADREVAFAANGLAVAFTTTRDGNEEIYVAGVDGKGQRNFSRHPGQDHQPAWAPDHRIAFTSSRAGGSHLFVARHDGNELRQLTNGQWGDQEPSWSPDSRSIVFSSDRDGGRDLYVLDVATLAVRRLTADPAPESQPDWGPDGSIAFVRGAPGAEQLLRINANGSGVVQLTDVIGGQSPAWSPDGARLAYVLGNRVYVQDAAKLGSRGRSSGIADALSIDWGRLPVATRPRARRSFTLTPSRARRRRRPAERAGPGVRRRVAAARRRRRAGRRAGARGAPRGGHARGPRAAERFRHHEDRGSRAAGSRYGRSATGGRS